MRFIGEIVEKMLVRWITKRRKRREKTIRELIEKDLREEAARHRQPVEAKGEEKVERLPLWPLAIVVALLVFGALVMAGKFDRFIVGSVAPRIEKVQPAPEPVEKPALPDPAPSKAVPVPPAAAIGAPASEPVSLWRLIAYAVVIALLLFAATRKKRVSQARPVPTPAAATAASATTPGAPPATPAGTARSGTTGDKIWGAVAVVVILVIAVSVWNWMTKPAENQVAAAATPSTSAQTNIPPPPVTPPANKPLPRSREITISREWSEWYTVESWEWLDWERLDPKIPFEAESQSSEKIEYPVGLEASGERRNFQTVIARVRFRITDPTAETLTIRLSFRRR